MKTLPDFQSATYLRRRARLIQTIRSQTGGGVFILGTAPESLRNRDSEYAYRHDSDFYYLTGFTEPQSLLVIQVNPDSAVTHFFLSAKRCGKRNLGWPSSRARSSNQPTWG